MEGEGDVEEVCVSDYKETILECFDDNAYILPGPPRDPGVKVVSEGTIEVTWDAPIRNPDVVDLIRIEYRDLSEEGSNS